MKTLMNEFINRVKMTNVTKTVFVLKGYEFTEVDNFYTHATNIEFKDFNNINQSIVFNELIESTKNNDNLYLHYHEFVRLSYLGIHGVFKANNYKIKLVDFNFFDKYYSISADNQTAISLEDMFSSDTDNGIQTVYSNIEINLNHVVYSYNDIDVKFDEIIFWQKLTSLKSVIIRDDTTRDYVVSSTTDIELVDIISSKIKKKEDFYYTLVDKQVDKSFFSFVLSSLLQSGIKCFHINPLINAEEIGFKHDYLSILKRLNSNPSFRNLKVYNNPEYGDDALIEISQEVIINEIYENALKALNSESFYDTFMTASTGAGKSIIFQIPAIKLAEEHDLLTLVITPLIGLMNDQVKNLKKLTNKAATINSEYTPIEKEKIKQDIDSNKISILYLSPETLLSSGDIKTLIGNRKIGLIVIDEAHTVATWGKSFRPDYWYLGDYLKSLKKYNKEMIFPIVAFTATATLGGSDDMYYDIVSDLSLNIKKPYIGQIIRHNISFDIKHHKKHGDYRQEKDKIVIERMNQYVNSGEKTLAYFPFIAQLKDTFSGILASKHSRVGKYHGRADKIDKDEVLEDFRTGKKTVVLATKAFGMGIDIDDIKNVYHYAPTGNLADYIQEIGRIARRKDMSGIASTDYYDEDFRYIKQLYGISSIKNYEVIAVVQKIISIYKTQKTRNFLVSPEEFAHIFSESNDENIDNKLKTVLLIIRKDLASNPNLQKYALIFKPRSMFTKGLYMIFDKDFQYFEKIKWNEFLTLYKTKEELAKEDRGDNITYMGSIFELDFKGLWDKYYKEMSFGQFKRALNEDSLPGVYIADKLKSKVWLEIDATDAKTFKEVVEKFKIFLELFVKCIDEFRLSKSHFTLQEFSEIVYKKHQTLFKNKTQSELISNVVLYLLNNLTTGFSTHNDNFLDFNQNTGKYSIKNIRYVAKRDELVKTAIKSFKNHQEETHQLFLRNNNKKGDKMRSDTLIVMAQIFELLGLTKYKIRAGDRPEFFMRVNSINVLEKMAFQQYESNTVKIINELHSHSIEIMKYFFTKLQTTNDRWNLIEKYFLGEDLELESATEELK